jgi:DNA polymerase-3 subunit alpha
MKVLDKIGLLKMDFLGLANLTMLSKALENIKLRDGIELDLSNLPLDDPKTYAMLSRGETRTVFQLEGPGMTRCVEDLRPSTLDHLAALVALYRPGPMAHIPSYIARRDGREAPTPPDPLLEDLLKDSYGIIVYQDQVLQVVRALAGYSLGQADVLRRAMGKKDKVVMAQEGPKFVSAVVQRGYSRETAEKVWDLLQPFAGYAFNKAHAYCYALVAYQTAYLKANYPVEWFAAVLSTIATDTDKVVGVVGECRRLGVEILPPDINASELQFRVEQQGIRFGLCAVKNVGEGAVELIVREREANGPYTSLEEFCRRQDLHTVNKRVLESLTKCGAMDALGQREALLDSKRLDSAIAAAQIDQRAASTGQASLFGDGSLVVSNAEPPTQAGAGPACRERSLWEKEVLGFSFGDHPFLEAAAWLAGKLTHDTSQLAAELSGERVKIAGLVTNVRRIVTRTKSQMAVVVLEDLHGSIEAVVFPRVYDRALEILREDAILVVEGKVDTRSDRPQIVVDRVEEWTRPTSGDPPNQIFPRGDPPNGRANGVSHTDDAQALSSGDDEPVDPKHPTAETGLKARTIMRVVVPRESDNACLRVLEQLQLVVQRSPGEDAIQLILHDRGGAPVELRGADIAVKHSAELESQVRRLVGEANLEVVTP